MQRLIDLCLESGMRPSLTFLRTCRFFCTLDGDGVVEDSRSLVLEKGVNGAAGEAIAKRNLLLKASVD